MAVEQKSPRKAKDQQYQVVSLHDRILAFEDYVKQKEQMIAKLTDEWNETQTAIIFQAMEILGPDPLEVGEEGMPTSMNKTIARAVEKNNHSNQQHREVLSRIADIEGRVKELTQQTKGTIGKQQKVCGILLNLQSTSDAFPGHEVQAEESVECPDEWFARSS